MLEESTLEMHSLHELLSERERLPSRRPFLWAKGGVWHKKDREAEALPHSSIDTEAAWSKFGWHGWVYGWKLHLATNVGPACGYRWLPGSPGSTPPPTGWRRC